MNNIFSTQFRQILLLVDQHLTTQDKERFRFYCSSFLPKSVKSMLEIFEVLEDQHVISYQDVKLLKEFSITIGRNDVAKLLAEYETRVSLKMVIYGYLDFKSGCRNVKSPMLLTTDCVSKHLVNGGSHSHDRVKVVVKKLHGTFALKFAFGNFIDKCFPISTEKYRWRDVLDVIQICAEFVYLRWMYMRNFKQMMSDIEEVVEDVLRIRIVPWMMKNGGMSGCYSVVAPVQNW